MALISFFTEKVELLFFTFAIKTILQEVLFPNDYGCPV